MKMKLLVSLLAAGMTINANAALTDIGSQEFIWTGVVPTLDTDVTDPDKGEYVIVPTIAGVEFDEGKLEFSNVSNGGTNEITLTQASKIGFKVAKKEGGNSTDVAYSYTLQNNLFSAVPTSASGAEDAKKIDDGYFDVRAAADDLGLVDTANTLTAGDESTQVAAGKETLLTVAQSEGTDLNKILSAGNVVQVKSILLIAAESV